MDDTDFIRALRSALNNLYEPDQLRNNLLVGTLGLEGRVDAPAALQEIIVQAIDAIREEGDDTNPRAWMTHDALYYRYVRGYGRTEVARKLNISDRQFSREVRRAIETLATQIWRSHALAASEREPTSALPLNGHLPDTQDDREQTRAEDSRSLESSKDDDTAATNEDATWLEDMPEESPSGWRDVFDSVLSLMQPVMAQHHTSLQISIAQALPDLLVAQNALRQSLLVLLGWMMPAGHDATIVLKPQVEGSHLILRWEIPTTAEQQGALMLSARDAISVPDQLLVRLGGGFAVESAVNEANMPVVAIVLTIPAMAKVPILVIDDNVDTIHLFQRYVQNSRYGLVGVSHPDDLARILERVQPRIILLDVMMPEIDGWDMLARLRQLPNMDKRAIVVCSIMPLESVARSLGANGFLQKPVLPQQLLQMLDTQMGQLSE